MSQEDQGKKPSAVITDAAVKEVIPGKSAGELSEKELDKVAAGVNILASITALQTSLAGTARINTTLNTVATAGTAT